MRNNAPVFAWVKKLCRRLFNPARQVAVWEELAAAATQAETAGDWLKAAELLAQLQAAHPDPARLLRLARCALLAGQWQQAANAYTEAGATTLSTLYHAGFALAKLDDFTGCLRHWQQIDCNHADFIAQQEQVGSLLIQELHCRLNENPIAQEMEVQQLLTEFSLAHLPGGAELLARCRNVRLARFWQEERMEEIRAMANEVDWLQPVVLAVQAKALGQYMATINEPLSPAQLRHFIDSWLSLLFHPEVGPPDETERQKLLNFGRELLLKQAKPQLDSGEQLFRQWEETLVLLRRLVRFTPEPIYTPALAVRTGITKQLFTLIQNNREHFADNDEWTAIGAAYSPAAQALLAIREGAYEAALEMLAEIEEIDEPCTAWGAAQVRTACGLHFLHQRQWREAEEILTTGQTHWLLELEKQLLAALEANEEQDNGRLSACINILSLLPNDAQTKGLFCTALTNQVMHLRSRETVQPRLFVTMMKKAVTLNPGDELAQMIFDQVCLNLELAMLNEAFDQDCFAEAANLARTSHFPQTIEHFLETARQTAARIERGDYAVPAAACFRLEELLKSVSRVDASHGAVRRIRQVLDRLRPEVERESF